MRRPGRPRRGSWSGLLRPKGNLARTEVVLVLLVAVLPLLMVVVRLTALPGVMGGAPDGTALEGIRAIGSVLNQTLSLVSVPPLDRDRVLYLLFLPTCALVIALARLTFGFRVLGFRSILIAVGFQESGIVPSLILIGVVVGTVVVVRPALRRIRLPYYARVSVILCISAMTLVAALLAGPWLRSEIVWSVAFFPVIVLGLLAEGIANTLDRTSGLSAAWRAGTTLVVALLLALVCQVPALGEVVLQFPELLVTQIAAIVLVSEFLDLRFFQDWDARLSGLAAPRLLSGDRALRVAVVRSRGRSGAIGRLGRSSAGGHGRRSVQRIVAALREGGHTVRVMEEDTRLLARLREFVPPDPRSGEPGGIVFNLAHGIQGEAPLAHVPAMLEMSGVPYTGPTPRAHVLAQDRLVQSFLLQQAGVPAPAFRVRGSPAREVHGLRYPLLVKPRRHGGPGARIIRDPHELEAALGEVLARDREEAVVEEYVAGREIQVAVLGNDPVECLPLVELRDGEPRTICPAPIEETLGPRIREAARAAFLACACRDYARVDVRLTGSGRPCVVGVASSGLFEVDGSFVLAAREAGYTLSELVCRIVEVARSRYLPAGAVRPAAVARGSHPSRAVLAGWLPGARSPR